MTGHERLPIVPRSLADETLSSWLERIWIFYGATYEMGIGALLGRANLSPLDQSVDIDSDPNVRDQVHRWTGISSGLVPKLLDDTTGQLLPVRARLAYCPACWDDDVAAGRAPYIRCQWTEWSRVHCRIHHRWLNARRPPYRREFYLMGWAPIWQTRANWAKQLELSADPLSERMLAGFDGAALRIPGFDWDALSIELSGFDADGDRWPHRAILQAIGDQRLESLRVRIGSMIGTTELSPAHILHVNSPIPMDLGSRIASLLIGVETRRIIAGRPPLMPSVAKHIESSEVLRGVISAASATKRNGEVRKVRSHTR